MSSAMLESRLPHASDERSSGRPLIVAWQHPETRRVSPVGLLDHDQHQYSFRYISGAMQVEGFRPFIGFGSWSRVYTSSWLFPMFAQRVVNPKRSDYTRWLDVLGLPRDVTPFEFLARCEGRREGDTVLVTAPPAVREQGRFSVEFLVAGVKYALRSDPDLASVLHDLRAGQTLQVVPEPENPKDELALQVMTTSSALGWVPRMLCHSLHVALREAPLTATVLRSNGEDAPIHMRLLVRVEGQFPVGWEFFSDPIWRPIGA